MNQKPKTVTYTHLDVYKRQEIDKALKKIKALKRSVEQMDDVIKKVAEKGYNVARDGFSTAIYDGNNDVIVNLEKISTGYKISAVGEAVMRCV